MICCQNLEPDQTESERDACTPGQLVLAMNESLLTGDVGLEGRPYLFSFLFYFMHVERCKPPDHRSWLNMEDITIPLYKSITETAVL